MKSIVSVSLGSSKRNHIAKTKFFNEEVVMERVGTDGSIEKAIALISKLDGKVDAFGMGGIDLYVYAGERRYTFRDARRLAAAAVKTPIVDGSGLKNTLERQVVQFVEQQIMTWRDRKVLLVSSVDRFGMAEALTAFGANIVFGDLMFGLGLNTPVRKLRSVNRLARVVLPIVTQMPFTWLYPTGVKQEKKVVRFENFYHWADVIAGDYIYIQRHMPDQLTGKTILTNTVTAENLNELKNRGIATLITTTPNFGGRSFGTNLLEALLIAFAGKSPEKMTVDDYQKWLSAIGC